MVRTEPSAPDRHLIQAVAASGLKLSPYQLERWRAAGLIPRPGPDTLQRSGNTQIYTSETAALVAGLLTCAPLCRSHDDLALLAFFNEVPVPCAPVRAALLKTYFTQYTKGREQQSEELQRIPAQDRDAAPPEYNWAEGCGSVTYRPAAERIWKRPKRRSGMYSSTTIWKPPGSPNMPTDSQTPGYRPVTASRDDS
ncbi:hypothetical protein SATRM34S_00033 [Streptomyces atroolivaceus]